jgi:hypothetical protein
MLTNNAAYNSSCRRCFFEPKGMTARQLEEGYLSLGRQLTSRWESLRRSFHRDPGTAAALFAMNLDLRRKMALQLLADRDEQSLRRPRSDQ